MMSVLLHASSLQPLYEKMKTVYDETDNMKIIKNERNDMTR